MSIHEVFVQKSLEKHWKICEVICLIDLVKRAVMSEKGWNKLSNVGDIKGEVKALFNLIDKDNSSVELSLGM